MKENIFQVPDRVNEPVKNYLKGSEERKNVSETYHSMFSSKMC